MPKTRFLRFIKVLFGNRAGSEAEFLRAEIEFNRLERFAHFWVLVVKSFIRNRCLIRASALSFSTLLALIPMLAVAISVTSSLLKTKGEQPIEQFVQKVVNNMIPPASADTNEPPEISGATNENNLTNAIAAGAQTNSIAGTNSVVQDKRVFNAQKKVAEGIHNFIQNTRSGTLGVVGMLALVFVAIRMLANIEQTFNDIWGVARGRTWLFSTALYWTVITLGPLLLIGALGLTSGTHFDAAKNFIHRTPFIGGLIFQLLPLVVLWLTFALIYQLVPNAKVQFSAAFIGGLVGGSLWHLNNAFGFIYASRVVTNGKIYGKLGLVPVFMAGIYFSWVILLFGAQVAYAFQNRKLFLQDKIVENVNQRGREFVALRLMTCICRRFFLGQKPISSQELSTELGIPTKLAQQVLRTLITTKLVVEAAGDESGYLPARPLEAISAHDILTAMRSGVGHELVSREEPMRAEIYGEFARIEEAERAAAATVTMLALVNRTPQIEISAPPEKKK
ncbi:MAG TPA: YhjD/YihY/BrkB family envelope integrity protein [Verrucomicrobiae bacterium]